MRQSIIYIVISFFIMGCLEKMPLPSDINYNSEFVAGDTNYLLINRLRQMAMFLLQIQQQNLFLC
jgi:hypothetical protein